MLIFNTAPWSIFMPNIEYYANNELRRINIQPLDKLIAAASPKPSRGISRMTATMASHAVKAVRSQDKRLTPIFHDFTGPDVLLVNPKEGAPIVIPTPTLVIEGPSKAELKKLQDKFGVEVANEGSDGKVLLKAKTGGEEGIRIACEAAKAAYERGQVKAAHPNFIRVMQHIKPSAAGGKPQWNHANDGNPGIAGADVAALAAWTIAKGSRDIRVAVLDEGVDTAHPDLKAAVVAEKDFVDNNPTAKPDGNDAHGTACAGIIVSRSKTYAGLAPDCSLVAVRIAKGDGANGWVFDDFKTADAIDWAWREGQADVLSNSWGGGPPVDVISRAFERARTKGRKNKGAVVAIAAGNADGPVNFPATIANVLAVGASNWWDERKSMTSKDGENWWGSNFGPELTLLAPGVRIATTDIHGPNGYDAGDNTLTFNGTSSATPHVAAAAALILSAVPSLNEKQVRDVITGSVDRLTADGAWNKYVGWGRLNIFAALRRARR